MTEYTAILEQGDSNWSAYVPDLPGCIAAAESPEETEALIREAIVLHIQLMREGGEPIPPSQTRATVVSIG